MFKKKQVSEVVFTQEAIWKFLGNRFVVPHIRGNAQDAETELVETGSSFAVLP
jgi:hypothetical protein